MKYFCSKCKCWMPADKFYPNKLTTAKYTWCKQCYAWYKKLWRDNNPEKNSAARTRAEAAKADREYEDALDQAVNFINAQAGR